MKKKVVLVIAVLAVIGFIVKMFSGVNVKSDSSCKSTLCKGFWSYEYNAEPMISKNGNFIFKKDGSCQYCTLGNQKNGTWSLGEAVEVTSKIAYRLINISMENDIGMGVGRNFQIKLYNGDKSSLMLDMASYYHFDDKSKPIQ